MPTAPIQATTPVSATTPRPLTAPGLLRTFLRPLCASLRAALTELRADGSMLNAVDKGLGNVTDALIDQGMWNSSLIILTSDNVCRHRTELSEVRMSTHNVCRQGGDCDDHSWWGGDDQKPPTNFDRYGPSSNYPLRGRKCEP